MQATIARRFALFAAVALSALAAAPVPGAAQIVPRLVDYPVYAVPACQLTPGSALATRRDGSAVAVYPASKGCDSNALLFTVKTQPNGASRTITPTTLGVATLAQSCGQYEWKAGTPQDVSAGDCGPF